MESLYNTKETHPTLEDKKDDRILMHKIIEMAQNELKYAENMYKYTKIR